MSILTGHYFGTRATSNRSWRNAKRATTNIRVIQGWPGLRRLAHFHVRPQALIHLPGNDTVAARFGRQLRRELLIRHRQLMPGDSVLFDHRRLLAGEEISDKAVELDGLAQVNVVTRADDLLKAGMPDAPI